MSEATAGQAPKPINWRSPGDLKTVGKELYGEFKRDNVTSLAAAFAYHTVFAIPALIILLVTVAAIVNRTTDVDVTGNLRELIAERAPANTRDLLNQLVTNAVADVGGGGAVFGVVATALIALWSGSNAIGALIDAFNKAYGVQESRKWVRKKALTIGLTLLLALFVNLAFALLVFGERIGSWIADRAGLGSVFDVVWNLTRWPAAIVAVGVVLTFLYYLGPNVEQSLRWVSPGSVLATVLWLLATAVIGIYFNYSDPGSAYPAVGSALALLFFLYVTGIVFLLGAELNAMLDKRYDPEGIEHLATSPDADPETRSEARATAAERGKPVPDGEEAASRPGPPRPAERPYAGLAAAAGTVALTRTLRGVGRRLARRRSG